MKQNNKETENNMKKQERKKETDRSIENNTVTRRVDVELLFQA